MKQLLVLFTAQNTETKDTYTSEIDVIANTDTDEILETILQENDIEDTENYVLLDEITSDEEIHANYLNINDIFEYAEAYNDSSYDLDVINAAIDCDVNLADIDEAYNGKHDSDEDFAEQLAEDLGLINSDAQWPNNCIDWEQAAKELMYDYSDSDGHYFRAM